MVMGLLKRKNFEGLGYYLKEEGNVDEVRVLTAFYIYWILELGCNVVFFYEELMSLVKKLLIPEELLSLELFCSYIRTKKEVLGYVANLLVS